MSAPVPLSQAISEFINSLPAPDAEVRYRRQLCAEVAAAARAEGYAEGREAEARERDRAWNAIAKPLAAGGVTHAELEQRRWGPGGREHFGDPRPGDRFGPSCQRSE